MASIISVDEFYHVGTINVNVKSFNTNYFDNGKDMLGSHGLILTNFNNSESSDFIEWLKYNVENDYMLNDSITEIDFLVNGEKITFKEDGKENNYVNMGEYHLVDNGKIIYISGGYLFVDDVKSNKKYMYYAD